MYILNRLYIDYLKSDNAPLMSFWQNGGYRIGSSVWSLNFCFLRNILNIQIWWSGIN